jgi:hypothetical protein
MTDTDILPEAESIQAEDDPGCLWKVLVIGGIVFVMGAVGMGVLTRG